MWPSWMNRWAECTDGRIDPTLEKCREALYSAETFGAVNTIEGIKEVIAHLTRRKEALAKINTKKEKTREKK